MTSTPRVTLGIPAYNEEKHLEQTVRQILAQTCPDFELLLADNGSTDGTRAIMEKLAAEDARIRILPSNTNQGAVWNFRRLLEAARGEYFAWIGAHDGYAPEWLEVLVQSMQNNPSLVHTYPLCRRTLPDGTVWSKEEQPLDTRGMPARERVFVICRHHGKGERVYGLFRTTAVQRASITTIVRWDSLFLARVALMGDSLGIDQPLWFRYYPQKPDRAHFHNTLIRQFGMLYPPGYVIPITHRIPHLCHLFYLARDAVRSIKTDGFRLVPLYWVALCTHHKRDRVNLIHEGRFFLKRYLPWHRYFAPAFFPFIWLLKKYIAARRA